MEFLYFFSIYHGKTRHTSSTFKSDEDKTVLDTSNSFWGQKWPIFAPKTAFLAHFEIIDGIYQFFQYPIWTKLGTLHQLLRLMKIKTVSDTSNSFLGPKWTIFVPKTAFLAHFEMEFLYFSISNMDETSHTSSTYKLEVSETVFIFVSLKS